MNSELRQDPVSGDWIVIAPGRARRPHELIKKLPKRQRIAVKGCPFENPQATGNKPILIYPDEKNWIVQIIKNKYPAVTHSKICGVLGKKGPFSIFPGIGHHDIVITRGHDKNFPKLSSEEAKLVFQSFRDRYLALLTDTCLSYVSIFHNWGPAAGASVYHPHYQIIGLPVVPPDVNHSLQGSARYYKENKECVHCVMLRWDKKEGKRIIYENKGAIAVAPFVSRAPFEFRVFPKKHLPYFENTHDYDMAAVVDALRVILHRFQSRLNDPDYNFFIHTAPVKDKEKYKHYHWHIEVFPKISIQAGFELGTGVEINVVDPYQAAKMLK